MSERSPYRIVFQAALLLLVLCGLFLTVGVHGQWDFALPLRTAKLAALLLSAYAVGVSTLLFQTVTANPILTPSVLGFDTLYLFLQTVLVALLGSTVFVQFHPIAKFAAEAALMLGASLLLFALLLKQGGDDLARMILIGVIFGILFRSLTGLLQRIIDPEEFVVVQANMFASFNTVDRPLLAAGAVVVAASAVTVWRQRYRLDIYLLGRPQVVNLGVAYRRNTLWILAWVAVLVATSTAMVGPVSFFGLLVCAITNHLAATVRHSVRIPLVFLVSACVLVGGQLLFEQLLGMKAVLGVVIEFAGGLVFLYLVLRSKRDGRY